MKEDWRIPELAPVLAGADHVDVKVVESRASLREFLAAMIAYQPGWVTFLYGVRMVLVRFLGLRQPGVPQALQLAPAAVPMTPGRKLAFFTVRGAAEDRYWVGDAADKHLTGTLVVVAAPLGDGRRRFYVVTVVHYHNWAGPVYFNLIRPSTISSSGAWPRRGRVAWPPRRLNNTSVAACPHRNNEKAAPVTRPGSLFVKHLRRSGRVTVCRGAQGWGIMLVMTEKKLTN